MWVCSEGKASTGPQPAPSASATSKDQSQQTAKLTNEPSGECTFSVIMESVLACRGFLRCMYGRVGVCLAENVYPARTPDSSRSFWFCIVRHLSCGNGDTGTTHHRAMEHRQAPLVVQQLRMTTASRSDWMNGVHVNAQSVMTSTLQSAMTSTGAKSASTACARGRTFKLTFVREE